MQRDDDFTIEKMKVREDLTSLMTEVRLTNIKIDENIKKLNEIITGNGHPETGHAFRLAQVEVNDKKRQGYMTAIFSTLGLIVTGVITDWISRIFFHHPKG